MAKKWAEVVDSDAYQALPDAEKTAARDQYFDQVVAPKVPKDDIETARKQFLDSTSLGDESAFMRGVKSYVPQTKGMLGLSLIHI